MALPTAALNVADTIFAGLSVVQFTQTTPVQITGVTATGSTDVVAKSGHSYTAGMLVKFVSGTGFTGLTAGTSYYVRDVVAGTSFKLAATATGDAIDITADGSAGVFEMSPIVFGSRMLDLAGGMQEQELKMPDSTGVLRVARAVTTEENEEFTFEVVDPKRMLNIFGGKLSGFVSGTAILYIPDPEDASGKCSLVSESFSCRVTRDGGLSFGNSDFTKAKIKIKSFKVGAITWTRDATV